MSAPAAIAPELRRAGAEALAYLEEAAALSARAEAALDAGDAEEVISLLQERSLVLQRSEAPLAKLREAPDGRAVANPEVESLIAEVLASAERLRPAEARMALALASERDRVGRELDQVDADEAVRSAYGKQTRARARINIVR